MKVTTTLKDLRNFAKQTEAFVKPLIDTKNKKVKRDAPTDVRCVAGVRYDAPPFLKRSNEQHTATEVLFFGVKVRYRSFVGEHQIFCPLVLTASDVEKSEPKEFAISELLHIVQSMKGAAVGRVFEVSRVTFEVLI